jgi:O-antigen ligase
MKPITPATPTDRYAILCRLFLLVLPLHGISFFEVGFNGSPDNIFIILSFLLLFIDYLIFDEVREYINTRLFSKEASHLILLLIFLFMSDVINVLRFGSPGFLADRMGSILLLVLFACGVSTGNHLRKILFCWMIASAYLALQNILSNLGITPAVEGSRFHAPRIMYGFRMPFHYAVGLPGDFGWHGMMLITGFISACYTCKAHKWAGILCALLCFGSIVMMQSRSTYLGFLVSVTMLVFFLVDKSRRKGVIFIALSPLLIFVAVWYREIFHFFQYAWRGFVDVGARNVGSRLLQFQRAIDIGMSHPLTGTGHNSFMTVTNLPYTIHNSFLYQLSSLGVVSFVLYCSAFVAAFFVSFRNMMPRRREKAPDVNPFLFCALAGVTVELNCFLAISGSIPWLLIYFILLANSLSAAQPADKEAVAAQAAAAVQNNI